MKPAKRSQAAVAVLRRELDQARRELDRIKSESSVIRRQLDKARSANGCLLEQLTYARERIIELENTHPDPGTDPTGG